MVRRRIIVDDVEHIIFSENGNITSNDILELDRKDPKKWAVNMCFNRPKGHRSRLKSICLKHATRKQQGVPLVKRFETVRLNFSR